MMLLIPTAIVECDGRGSRDPQESQAVSQGAARAYRVQQPNRLGDDAAEYPECPLGQLLCNCLC
jgi:hypothetical protein